MSVMEYLLTHVITLTGKGEHYHDIRIFCEELELMDDIVDFLSLDDEDCKVL